MCVSPVALRCASNKHGEVKVKQVATSPGNPRHCPACTRGSRIHPQCRTADAGAGGGKEADRMLSRRGLATHVDMVTSRRTPARADALRCSRRSDGRRPTGLPVARSDPTTPRLRGIRLVFRLSVARPRGRRTGKGTGRRRRDAAAIVPVLACPRPRVVGPPPPTGPAWSRHCSALVRSSVRAAGQGRAPVSSRRSPLVRDSLWRQVATHSLLPPCCLSRSAARLQARSSIFSYS